MISSVLLERALKRSTKAYCQLSFFKPIHHLELPLQAYQDWTFSHKNTSCKKPTQMHKTQYLDLFFNYHEGIIMNTRYKNPIVVDEESSSSQQ